MASLEPPRLTHGWPAHELLERLCSGVFPSRFASKIGRTAPPPPPPSSHFSGVAWKPKGSQLGFLGLLRVPFLAVF